MSIHSPDDGAMARIERHHTLRYEPPHIGAGDLIAPELNCSAPGVYLRPRQTFAGVRREADDLHVFSFWTCAVANKAAASFLFPMTHVKHSLKTIPYPDKYEDSWELFRGQRKSFRAERKTVRESVCER